MANISNSDISLSKSDIPGAKLVYDDLSPHTAVQLKRELACRGLLVGKQQTLRQ
jgi:hypothetical protein